MRDVEITKTERGFARINFKDCYGEQCSIQKSSLATDDAIWLGQDKPTEHKTGDLTCRMHLTKADACRLISVLECFVEFGELPDTIAECGAPANANDLR